MAHTTRSRALIYFDLIGPEDHDLSVLGNGDGVAGFLVSNKGFPNRTLVGRRDLVPVLDEEVVFVSLYLFIVFHDSSSNTVSPSDLEYRAISFGILRDASKTLHEFATGM